MRKILVAGAVAALCLFGVTGTAVADHEGGDCNDTENCQDNDFSPSFKDSPVRDAFNFSPVICLPGSTCNVDGGKDEPAP